VERRVLVLGMNTTAIGGLLLVLAGVPSLAGARQPRAAETPRATDLLRAERLAEQARKRLELPRKRPGGWAHGGGGWNETERAAPPSHVTINVRAAQRRAPSD
jgi:hypothetical protein